jgi:hypothetical protein
LVNEPTDAAKYERDHSVGRRLRRCGNSRRSIREVKPMNCDAKCVGELAGALDEQMHVVGHDVERMHGGPSSADLEHSNAFKRTATSDTSTGRRLLRHHTGRYLSYNMAPGLLLIEAASLTIPVVRILSAARGPLGRAVHC